MEPEVVIWGIVGVGIVLMLIVFMVGQSQIGKPPPRRPAYWELQRLALRHDLAPGYHTIYWHGRPFDFLVSDHNRVEPDPVWGKYWGE